MESHRQQECLFLAAWWISRSWQLGCAPTIGFKPTVDAPSAQLRLLLPDIPNLHVGSNTCDCSLRYAFNGLVIVTFEIQF